MLLDCVIEPSWQTRKTECKILPDQPWFWNRVAMWLEYEWYPAIAYNTSNSLLYVHIYIMLLQIEDLWLSNACSTTATPTTAMKVHATRATPLDSWSCIQCTRYVACRSLCCMCKLRGKTFHTDFSPCQFASKHDAPHALLLINVQHFNFHQASHYTHYFIVPSLCHIALIHWREALIMWHYLLQSWQHVSGLQEVHYANEIY